VSSEGRTGGAFGSLPTEEQQGIALFLSHGVGDAATTVLAAADLGAGVEANPFMRAALEQGFGFAAGVMLLVVGGIALVYPTVSEISGIPDWFGWALVAVGVLVSLGNIGVVLA